MEIREKLALETLREKTNSKGDSVLPQAECDKPVTGYLGGKPNQLESKPEISCDKVLQP